MHAPAALVLIDLQQAMRLDSLPPRNNPQAEDRIAQLPAGARTAGDPGFDTVVADACFTFDKQDFDGTWRSAEEGRLMALANLDGEYARVRTADAVLADRRA